jgi:hypothetical protein
MHRYLPLLGAVALLATTGVVHGLRTQRWGVGSDVTAAVGRLSKVPLVVGSGKDAWKGVDVPMDADQLRIAQADGHLSRIYTNELTGDKVSLLILCGRSGPLSVHTPNVCYTASGYEETQSEPATVGAAGCRTDLYRKAGATPLRVFWTWSDGGAWSAPENPRWTFARSAHLYKMYLVHPLTRPEEGPDKDAAARFLKVLLPSLDQGLLDVG